LLRGAATIVDMPRRGPELVVVSPLKDTSPAFIRELLRRAALGAPIAAGGTLRVTDREPQWALDDPVRSSARWVDRLAPGSIRHRR
jgi:hypothetical protein